MTAEEAAAVVAAELVATVDLPKVVVEEEDEEARDTVQDSVGFLR